jgi:asparagine synthase (glutamine-hydrolysing)
MVSDVPFGVLLSGGVDSSLNVALMSKLMDRPVITFTIGYEGEESTNEFKYARRISERYHTEHHESLINHKDAQDFLRLLVRLQDEPIADNVCIPLYFLAKVVRECGTAVVQVGESADENFLGYWWYEDYRKKPQTIYHRASRAGWVSRFFGKYEPSPRAFRAEDDDIRKRALRAKSCFGVAPPVGGAGCGES